MKPIEQPRVESETISDFSKVMQVNPMPIKSPGDLSHTVSPKGSRRLNLDAEKVKNGLGQLVLTVVKLLQELLERQAIRRIDAGSLNDDDIERIGFTLMKQHETIEKLRLEFGLEEEDLNLDLGPLGKLL